MCNVPWEQRFLYRTKYDYSRLEGVHCFNFTSHRGRNGFSILWSTHVGNRIFLALRSFLRMSSGWLVLQRLVIVSKCYEKRKQRPRSKFEKRRINSKLWKINDRNHLLSVHRFSDVHHFVFQFVRIVDVISFKFLLPVRRTATSIYIHYLFRLLRVVPANLSRVR